MNWKKILLIIGFILLSVLIALAIYFVFFRPAPPAEEVPPEEAEGRLPGVPEGEIPREVTVEPAALELEEEPPERAPRQEVDVEASPIALGGLTETTTVRPEFSQNVTLAPDGRNMLYYDQQEGLFYGVNPDGRTYTLSNRVFHNVENVTWTAGKNEAIIEYPDGSNIFYDFDQDRQVTLPNQWEEFDYSEKNNQIVFKEMNPNPDNQWLGISSPDGDSMRYIEPMGENADKVIPSWSPTGQMAAFYVEPFDIDRSEVFFVGLHHENFRSTIVEGRGFQGKWSEQGDRLLYSVYNSESNYNPKLWIVDAQGDNIGRNRRSLDINTWVDKCTFYDNQTVYCAVPQYTEDGMGMVPEVADDIPDDIYKIDLSTGLSNRIARPDGDYTIEELIISEDGSQLYFVEKDNNTIHKLKLK